LFKTASFKTYISKKSFVEFHYQSITLQLKYNSNRNLLTTLLAENLIFKEEIFLKANLFESNLTGHTTFILTFLGSQWSNTTESNLEFNKQLQAFYDHLLSLKDNLVFK
jgi:hypothetical protein